MTGFPMIEAGYGTKDEPYRVNHSTMEWLRWLFSHEIDMTTLEKQQARSKLIENGFYSGCFTKEI